MLSVVGLRCHLVLPLSLQEGGVQAGEPTHLPPTPDTDPSEDPVL